MLKSLVLVLLPVVLLGAVPTIDRPVVDTSGRLSSSDREAVATGLVRLRQETGVQMAVLMVDTTGGVPIEDYSIQAARAWRGGEQGRDNGLLLVLAVGDRRQRLEVGYGLEEFLPDGAARTLLDAQGPLLRQGDYRGALLAVVEGVHARLPGAEGAVTDRATWRPADVNSAFLALMFTGLVAGVLAGLCLGPWKERLGTVALPLVVGALAVLPPCAVSFAVRSSGLSTANFVGVEVLFAAWFFVLTLFGNRVSRLVSVLATVITLVSSGLAAGPQVTTNPLNILVASVIFSSFFVTSLFLFWAIIRAVRSSRGSWVAGAGGDSTSSSSSWSDSSSSSWSSSDSSSSSSSSSDSSWGGGGGDFGGGGSSSSW